MRIKLINYINLWSSVVVAGGSRREVGAGEDVLPTGFAAEVRRRVRGEPEVVRHSHFMREREI